MKHAVDVLRVLYAINYEDDIPVYQLDFDDLDQYLNDSKLPPKHFLVPAPQAGDEDESEGDVDEGPTKTPGPGISMSSKVSLKRLTSFGLVGLTLFLGVFNSEKDENFEN